MWVTRRRAVAQSRLVHDQVDRRGGLLADRSLRQVDAGHQHHRLEPRQRVARRVRVQRGERAVVAGVHRLQHVERRAVADLADDDAVGPHAQRVAHEVAGGDLAPSLDVRRTRLQPDDVLLAQLQFGGVLDRDDALVARDERRQHVQRRRLARAGAAADEDVQPAAHAGREQVRRRGGHRAEVDEIVDVERVGGELADRQHRAVERDRRQHRVDAAAVGQARVDHRARLVDAASDPARRSSRSCGAGGCRR